VTHQATFPGAFPDRHIGVTAADADRMLAVLGLASLDDLIDQAVPATIRDDKPLALDDAISEPHALAHLRRLADRNRVLTSLIGQGYYGTHTPGVILRNVLENPAWYTAYTPYQPEISQGRLEALLNFQTMVCDLTGLDIANASMLDEATAAAEAMTLCRRSSRHAGGVFFVDAECHPQTIAVVATRAEPLGIEVAVGDPSADLSPADTFGVLLQHPGTSGVVRDLRPVIEAVHAAGGLAVVATDLLACTLLVPPGELGADAAVGSAQRFGVPMAFGGPHAGFLATRDAYRRSLPGRLVGVSIDAAGRPAHRLALQTREQHIRREKATSNICTAQVLLAVMASMYAVYHGPEGLEAIAERVHMQATATARTLGAAGFEVVNDSWFDTLTVRAPGQAAEILERAREAGVNLRRVDGDTLGLSFDETTAPALPLVLAAFGVADGFVAGDDGIPARELRRSEFLTHPVFHEHRSETEMLRYLRRLADKDVALDRAMIPLGSCTMKLNATTEMEPVTWPEFADVHPFAPRDQAEGYLELIHELEAMLGEMTGYDAVSLQPNAGSQGELAGLLAIRAYHRSRGDEQRDVCLIPSSAHGTNAASAVMAGMRVVVVACDDRGNVDVDDFRAKAAEHGERLAALMATYPSTHGVFESRITEICDVVHEHGGQVYVDGANLNALVGVARPGWFGGDISHLNLHKTFCIPHGGGGPGVGGPLGIRRHPAHQLHLRQAHGGGRPAPRHRGGDPQRQLHRRPPRRPLPGPLHGGPRAGGARVHRRRARHHPGYRCHRRRRGQALDRLRVPRPDDELPGGGHADDRAHRVGVTGRDRPVLRRHDRHQGRDRPGGERRVAAGRQPAAARPAHRGGPAGGQLGPALLPGAGRLSGVGAAPRQVLAAGQPHRRRLWRSPSRMRLPAAAGARTRLSRR
jgi:glycine dehydrogenase